MLKITQLQKSLFLEMSMENLEASQKVRNLVETYCASERNPGLNAFKVHGPFTVDSLRSSDIPVGPGCYIIYGADGVLRYIGASAAEAKWRVLDHFIASTQLDKSWRVGSPATFIEIIEVTERWEPFSLEEYLTVKTKGFRFSVN